MTNAAMGALPIGSRISGIQFRLEGGGAAGPASALAYTDYEITLAQATNAVGSMSSTLASNMASPIKVTDGPYTRPANSFPGTGTPRDFGSMMSFDDGYTYQGGDLVMLLTHNGNAGGSVVVDAVSTDASGTGGFRALSTPVGFQQPTADNTAFRMPVFQLVYDVPEVAVKGNNVKVFDNAGTTSVANNTSFGLRQLGSIATLQFTILNVGGAPLTLSTPNFTGPFSLSGAFPSSIPADSSTTFTVLFDTSTQGAFTGSVSFDTNDADEGTFNFALSGETPEPSSLCVFLGALAVLARRRH